MWLHLSNGSATGTFYAPGYSGCDRVSPKIFAWNVRESPHVPPTIFDYQDEGQEAAGDHKGSLI